MTPSLIVKGRDGVTAREPLQVVPFVFGALENAMYRVLLETADRGHPLPTNAEFAAAINVTSTSTASDVLGRLHDQGAIILERRNNFRSVTLRDGRTITSGSMSNAQKEALAAENYVYREPCPRCGVRADVGCKHSARWSC